MEKAQRNLYVELEKVLSVKFEELVNSDLALTLLFLYSTLYKRGEQLPWCAACMRDYYKQLNLNGLEMIDLYLEAKNRTCIPNFKGLRYVREEARHYSNEYLTDAQAIYLLNAGYLKENEFIKLPDGYNSKTTHIENVISEAKKVITKPSKVKKNK